MPAPDLRTIDELCRLVLAARRLGCQVRLEGACDELRAILELTGVDEFLLDGSCAVEPDERDLR